MGRKRGDLLGTVELGANLNISTQFEEEEEDDSSSVSHLTYTLYLMHSVPLFDQSFVSSLYCVGCNQWRVSK